MKNLMAKEPAVTLGFVASVADVAYQVAAGHPGMSWQGLLPLILAAVIRSRVKPA